MQSEHNVSGLVKSRLFAKSSSTIWFNLTSDSSTHTQSTWYTYYPEEVGSVVKIVM